MVGTWLCRLGVHGWLLCKFWPHRFCKRCGLLQAWRLPGRKSWTTVGSLQGANFDGTAREIEPDW